MTEDTHDSGFDGEDNWEDAKSPWEPVDPRQEGMEAAKDQRLMADLDRLAVEREKNLTKLPLGLITQIMETERMLRATVAALIAARKARNKPLIDSGVKALKPLLQKITRLYWEAGIVDTCNPD